MCSTDFAHPHIETVIAHADAAKYLKGIQVESHEQVLLVINGQVVETTAPASTCSGRATDGSSSRASTSASRLRMWRVRRS